MSELIRVVMTLPPGHAPDEAEMLSALLAAHVPHGWEEELLPAGEMRCIAHFSTSDSCAGLAGHLRATLPSLRMERDSVPEKNWMEAWKEFFTPVEAGSHFLVLAPWMEKEKAQTTRIPVIIEPKTAFGTGHHASTALCLEAVSSLFTKGMIRPGGHFLDLGTGSGILGIGCARLGLSGLGLDIDPDAVDNAVENRGINDLTEKDFRVRLGSLQEAAETAPYDIILANILAEPLKGLAPLMASLSGPGEGRRPLLVLSGLLNSQADDVESAYTSLGWTNFSRLSKEEWTALILSDGRPVRDDAPLG